MAGEIALCHSSRNNEQTSYSLVGATRYSTPLLCDEEEIRLQRNMCKLSKKTLTLKQTNKFQKRKHQHETTKHRQGGTISLKQQGYYFTEK